MAMDSRRTSRRNSRGDFSQQGESGNRLLLPIGLVVHVDVEHRLNVAALEFVAIDYVSVGSAANATEPLEQRFLAAGTSEPHDVLPLPSRHECTHGTLLRPKVGSEYRDRQGYEGE